MSINIGGIVYPATIVGETTKRHSTAVGIMDDGPKGDPGPQGPSGPAGATGAPGASGPTGASGATGEGGASAYQVWLSAGNTGTVEDYIASLIGPRGPVGPAGDAALFHRWIQGTPARTWTITHPLNRPVSVDVVDSAGSLVLGDVTYLSSSELTIEFSAPFAGEAYLT